MNKIDFSKYKGIVSGYPQKDNKVFYMEIVLLINSDKIPSTIEDSELQNLLKNINDDSVSAFYGDFDEDFEEYIESIEEDLEQSNLTPFYYIRIQRSLPMTSDGFFITKDNEKIEELLSEEDQEKYMKDIGVELENLLSYIDIEYLKLEDIQE